MNRPYVPGAGRQLSLVLFLARRFSSDPRLVMAALFASAGMYFSPAWRKLPYPFIEAPLSFGLQLVGVLTFVVVVTRIPGFASFLRRLTSRKWKAAAPARTRTAKHRLTTAKLFRVAAAERFPAISLGRASQHIFHSWTGDRIFESDLGRYDHGILLLASLLAALTLFSMELYRRHYGAWLLFPGNGAAQMIVDWGFLIGLVGSLTPGHYRAHRAAESVAYNALRFENANEARIDEDILSLVHKFENATGWRVIWSRSSNRLVGADRCNCAVTLSVGWILLSDRPEDRRRAAYLAEVLRLIRRAISLRLRDSGVSGPRNDRHGSRFAPSLP